MLTLFVRLRLACWSSAVTAAPYLFSSEVIQNRWFKTSPRKMWKAYCGGFKTRVATWTKDDMTGPAIRLGRAVSAAFCVQTHFINAISRSFKLGANWNKNVNNETDGELNLWCQSRRITADANEGDAFSSSSLLFSSVSAQCWATISSNDMSFAHRWEKCAATRAAIVIETLVVEESFTVVTMLLCRKDWRRPRACASSFGPVPVSVQVVIISFTFSLTLEQHERTHLKSRC